MNIDIDIVRMIGADGKAVCYGVPKVYWTVDESDTVTPEQMNRMRDKIQRAVQNCLDEANNELERGGADTSGLIH